MNKDQVLRLATHVSQISYTLIQQIDSDGVIRSFATQTLVTPDLVASHHVVELLRQLDGKMFAHEIEAMISWMVDPEHGAIDDPFTLDSYTQVCEVTEENTELLKKAIVETRLSDGSFTKYTAHLRGGDFFSTLWATKILQNYSGQIFADEITRALEYLIGRQPVAATEMSQTGFLALLLMRADAERHKAVIQKLMGEVIPHVRRTRLQELNGLQLMDTLYLLEDCARYAELNGDVAAKEAVMQGLSDLFELTKDAERIPAPMARVEKQCAQSLYYQILCRACLVGAIGCQFEGYKRLHFDLNELVHGGYRRSRYIALAAQAELKKYLEKYSPIHKKFAAYNDQLETIWQSTPFEQSVFIMMPFKRKAEYRLLTEAIKSECRKLGYHAIRVDDEDRRFSERLWDNLIINMLSCKFAVAVYVSDHIVDQLTDQVRLFANPNVALEFGFFCSRGQDIMILKDKKSPLPSDLQGFLWNEFDIENADETVGSPLARWLKKLAELADEKKEPQPQNPAQ